MDDAVVNWSDFDAKHHDVSNAFEDLSLLLFTGGHNFNLDDCRLSANQTGFEVEP